MDRFVARENVRRFLRLLEKVDAEAERRRIGDLLEQARQDLQEVNKRHGERR